MNKFNCVLYVNLKLKADFFDVESKHRFTFNFMGSTHGNSRHADSIRTDAKLFVEFWPTNNSVLPGRRGSYV